MCISIPSIVFSINGEAAVVSVGCTENKTSILSLNNVKTDNYILAHSMFYIQKNSEARAQETLKFIKEVENPEKQIDDERIISINYI